jgi:hypothetical protein
VWEILREAGVDPAAGRAATTWTQFLRSQAEALLAADFIETATLTGARMNILAVIENASRRIRILGATAHPSAGWVTQTARNLVMDLEDAGCRVKHLIRDRDGGYPLLFDRIFTDAGITVVRSGIQVPRMTRSWSGECGPAAARCLAQIFHDLGVLGGYRGRSLDSWWFRRSGVARARLVAGLGPGVPLAGRVGGAFRLVGAGGAVVMAGRPSRGSCSRPG